ncbi:MAG: ribonuclease Z [Clostridia bacterium]|nr:ribonuclease Z [Clostridia bacterium]
MKLTFLGSCSGTEPMPGRHHCSFVIESAGKVYFFDAGENCAYTAFTLGIDVTKMEKIVISHPHIDHVGGLPNLLAVVRKMISRYKITLDHDIDVYIYDLTALEGAKLMLKAGEAHYETSMKVNGHIIDGGLVFDDGNMRVISCGNTHLKPREDGKVLSYSFLIECEGKRILYTGDIGHISEVRQWLGQCDLLIMETGHHMAEEVAGWLYENSFCPPQVWFNHHGRAMLADPQGQVALARKALGSENVFYSNDGQSLML